MFVECSGKGILLWRVEVEMINVVHNEVGNQQHARSPAEERLNFAERAGNG